MIAVPEALRSVYGLSGKTIKELLEKFEFGEKHPLKEIEYALLLTYGEEKNPEEVKPTMEWMFCNKCQFYDAYPVGARITCKCGGRLV